MRVFQNFAMAAIALDSRPHLIICCYRAEDFMSVNHEYRRERNIVYVPNRPFPLNNGPVVKSYDAFE